MERDAGATRPASRDDVDRVRPHFARTRDQYCFQRYLELDCAKLAFVATKLSTAYLDTNRLTRRQANKAIGSALECQGRGSDRDSVMIVRDRLHDLGYILSVIEESRHYYVSGIPSLMRFVARCEGIDVSMESL